MNLFKLSDVVVKWVDWSVYASYNNVMIAQLESEPTAQIRWIWVDPQYRRQGVAKLMLTEVERRTGLIAHPLPPVSVSAQNLFQ